MEKTLNMYFLYLILLTTATTALPMNGPAPQSFSFLVHLDNKQNAARVIAQCRQAYDAPKNPWEKVIPAATKIDAYLSYKGGILMLEDKLRIEIFDSRESIISKLKNQPWFSEENFIN